MLNEKLQQLGFTSTDYSLNREELIALPQTRMVEQIIEHPADETHSEPWQESIQVEETFYAQLPSVDELKRLCVLDNDPALLIGEYLKGKPVTDDDSLNIDLFMNGQGGWRFSQVEAPTWAELYDLIPQTVSKVEQEKINAEALAYLASTDFMVLRHIRQVALGQELSLTEEDYLSLEQSRSEAASRVRNE